MFVVFEGEVFHVADGLLFQEADAHRDGEEHAEGEPEGDEWYHTRPIVVDDSFKHDRECRVLYSVGSDVPASEVTS